MNPTEIPLTFEPLTSATLGPCCEIAATAPDPWSPASMESTMNNLNCWSFVALHEGVPVGFAVFLVVDAGADLQQIVIHEKWRGKGIGRQLLQHAMPQLAEYGVIRILLEARASNAPALKLYESLGFKRLTLRSGMYSHPKEDGVLMVRLYHQPPPSAPVPAD